MGFVYQKSLFVRGARSEMLTKPKAYSEAVQKTKHCKVCGKNLNVALGIQPGKYIANDYCFECEKTITPEFDDDTDPHVGYSRGGSMRAWACFLKWQGLMEQGIR